MSRRSKLLILAALIGAVVLVMEYKKRQGPTIGSDRMSPAGSQTAGSMERSALAPSSRPRLINLGAGHCMPCKMMKPILTELRTGFATRFETISLDIAQNREEAQEYGVRVIPTQIFADAQGKELFRHEGFMSKDDILAKWQELEINFSNE